MPSRIQTNIPESATIFYAHSSYYLFYHYSGGDEVYRIGPSPAGPWSEPRTIAPGWAHEVWTGQAGLVYTSYLTSYAVTISPLTWNMAFDPPRPFIGSQVFNTILPLILRYRRITACRFLNKPFPTPANAKDCLGTADQVLGGGGI